MSEINSIGCKPVAVPFRPEHLEQMALRATDAEDVAGLDLHALAGQWAGQPAWTVLVGDDVAACYGAQLCGGTATLWALTSCLVEAHPLRVTRTAQALLRWLTGPMNCHRVEALVLRSNGRSRRWLARMLGMRVEGLLRSCGPNRRDRFVMAVIATGERK